MRPNRPTRPFGGPYRTCLTNRIGDWMNACVNLPMFVLTLLHYFNRGLKSLSLPHRLLHGAQLVIQGQGKSKGKSPKGGKGKQTWVAEYKVGDEWRPICMKFQSNRCSMENCKFAHVCAHPRNDGSACAGRHSAFDHQTTSH